MTTIAAITDGKKVYLGADSGITDGEFIGRSMQPKVFKIGDLLIGYCGSIRAANIVRYEIDLPTRPEQIDELEWISRYFVDAVRIALADNGYPDSEKEEDRNSFGMIVGVNGRIFEVEYNFSVIEWDSDWMAVGSGGKYAIGALDALSMYTGPTDEQERLELAIGFAINNDPSSHGPVVVISE